MMNLRSTLKLAHNLLDQNKIPHALIGGLAMACYGSTRATVDLDLLVQEQHKDLLKKVFLENGFALVNETIEVLQFSGVGYVDILLARRPISEKILKESNPNGPEGIHFVKTEDLIGLKIQAYINDPSRELQDKADIQFLIENVEQLDWKRIKSYADLFNQWEVINDIKSKIKS
ncbi:MAG: hypothetical protein AB7I27_06455 [Bacteriovoracaceae bacterium]